MNFKKALLDIETQLYEYKQVGKKIFLSSSFQTHSIPLLRIISSIDSSIPVYFLDTGFHFPETHIFKDQIKKFLGINIISIYSPIPKINQIDKNGRFFFCGQNAYCCHINKVLPLEPILMKHDVWISGIRRDQNSNRKTFKKEQRAPHDTVRYHPLLNWTSRMIWEYRKIHDLPSHPLEQSGYFSIGCAPCTSKTNEEDRSGRWAGSNKTECGLHTELIV